MISEDHHRPRYHVRPLTGYVNDPNGPVRFGGQYHLYFQYVLDTPRTGAVRWGHATSADLAGWTIEADALVPTQGGLDEGGCWSGNVIEHDGALYAFYSAFDPGSRFQPVHRAVSSDGFTFTDSVRVVEAPEADGCVQFRDPFVWRHGESWWMVVGAGMPEQTAQARLYESTDLLQWTYAGPLLERRRDEPAVIADTGMMWECPQYANSGDRGALFIGTFDEKSAAGVMRVLSAVGNEAGSRLTDPQYSMLDQGSHFYAASVLRGEDRNLLWGWVTEGRSREWTIEADWSGMLSLPREITLDGDRVASRPAAELTALRAGAAGRLTGNSVLDAVPAQVEIEAELARPASGASRIELRTGADERLVLTADWNAGTLTLDSTGASRDARAHGVADTIALASSGNLSLRWFLDGSVSELFTGSGEVLTQRFYPQGTPPWSIRTGEGVSGTLWLLRTDAVHVPESRVPGN